MNDLVVVQTLTPAVVFAPGGVDSVISKIEAEVRSFNADISTDGGRKAIASLAYKVARSKTALDDMGKELVSDLKAQAGKIDAERRTIRERLDALKDEVRQPLTDWENAEKNRVEAHEAAIAKILQAADIMDFSPSSQAVAERIAILGTLAQRDWQEFAKRADEALETSRSRLEAMHRDALKREQEAAELARLRAEQIAREQKERDERIAAEAAERARAEAEAKARREAEEAAARAAAEQRRIEQEAAASEARAKQAEADRLAAIAKAEADAEAAAEAAERRQQEAIAAERRRVAEADAAAKAEQAKREANTKHRAKINNEVLAAIVAVGAEAELAQRVVVSIARGDVPHTKISY